MSKLTMDDMFRIVDSVEDFLESNLGRDVVFKRSVDQITITAKGKHTPISEEDAEKLKTVKDVVNFISSKKS